MKKFLVVLLLVSLTIIVGCGSNNTNNETQEQSTETENRATDGTISFIVLEDYDYSLAASDDGANNVYFSEKGQEEQWVEIIFAITYPFEFSPNASGTEVLNEYEKNDNTYIEWSKGGMYEYCVSIDNWDILVYTAHPELVEDEVKTVAESIVYQ